jgi:hypothetical protein
MPISQTSTEVPWPNFQCLNCNANEPARYAAFTRDPLVNVGTNGIPLDWQEVRIFRGGMEYQRALCPRCIEASL